MYTILSFLKAFFQIIGLFVFLTIGALATWIIGLIALLILGTISIVPYLAHRLRMV